MHVDAWRDTSRRLLAAAHRRLARAAATCLATLRRFMRRRAHGRLGALKPHWTQALILGVFLPLFAAVLIDPVYITGRGAWAPEVLAFGRLFHTFGKSGWYLWPLGLFLVATAFVDWTVLKRRALARLAARTQAAWFCALALGGGEVVSSLLKQTIGRARPQLAAEEGLFAFRSWTLDHAWASFPSGHATTFGALCSVLALVFPHFKWLLLCIALALASTRVIVGAHYPSDVLAGLVLGGWIAYAWATFFARRRILFKADAAGRLALRWRFGLGALARASGLAHRRPRPIQAPRAGATFAVPG